MLEPSVEASRESMVAWRRNRHQTGPPPDWRASYQLRLAVSDTICAVWAVTGTQLIWFGFDSSRLVRSSANLALNYTAFSVLIALLWVASLSWFGSHDPRTIGTETTEYKTVVDASLRLFGGVAIAAFLLRLDLARGYFLLALPFGLLAILSSRWMWRQWLRVQRREGSFSFSVLVVGSASSVAPLARELARHPEAGYVVAGVCVPTRHAAGQLAGLGVPVWTGLDDLPALIRDIGVDTVAITSSDHLPPERVRQLSWSLEEGRQQIVVAPSLTDIAWPRIHTRPVAGLPLIHVESPRFEGRKLVVKRTFDVVVAGILVVLLAPLYLTIAALVRITSGSPVLYRQERIGLGGEPFHLLKFRTMRPHAEEELPSLLAAQGTSATPLFKVRNDPRVTRLGRVLRKYSLDELPQLFNVLTGDMSLVGPRPQIAGEVALYDSAAERRLLLKPGISGLWQVSGRSSLSWEDALRLDLYYVENWSITADLVILFKTARAVLAPGDGEAH